jgi:simple sugar transport system substrate-binding protein
MGQRIATEVTSGDILIGISQPGSLNVQPRLDGIKAAMKAAAPGVTIHTVDTGAAQADELNAMESAYQGLKSAKGVYAVDAGSTASIAQMITKYNIKGQVHAGGFDLLTVGPYASANSWIEGGSSRALGSKPSSISLPAPSTVQS